MKVLHVIPSVSPLRGGPSVAVRTIARGLSEQGVTVHVATTDDNGRGRLSVPCGRPVVEDGFTCWYFRRQTRFYTISWPLCRWLARHAADYDLIHIHALFSFAPTVAAFWAARHGVPYVVRPLGTLNTWGVRNRRAVLKQLSLRLIDRRVLANAASVHFTSDQERREAELAAPCGRSFVIPNPVRAGRIGRDAGAFFVRYPDLAPRRIVLFLSRLDPKKGLDLLLNAFAKVLAKVPDVALVVAGEGDRSFVTGLEEQARSLGVAPDVIWTGFLDGDEKQAAFAAASVFALPSYSENFGIAVVEAMAHGLPVVVSNQVGIHREIEEANAGLVVNCDPDETAAAILRMLGEGELRLVSSRNALGLAARFRPEAVTERLLKQYRILLAPEHFEDAAAYITY